MTTVSDLCDYLSKNFDGDLRVTVGGELFELNDIHVGRNRTLSLTGDPSEDEEGK